MVNTVMAVGSRLATVVDLARREPAKVLLWVLGFHLVVWSILPILVCLNLQLDLVEGLALGKEWQLGYWKHPPLPWWVSDLAYRIVGHVDVVYVLGPLAVVVCFYAVWLLAREVAGELKALVAVLALEGIHFYNFSAVKFSHDIMQLPFWAFAGLFFYRAITRERALDWLLAGAFLALAFWSKYAAFALAATLSLFLLLDPVARRAWRTPGPYLMALAFLVVIGPNLWWLVKNDFMPFRYVDARAVGAAHWYEYVEFPVRWIASQGYFLLPVMLLLALLIGRRGFQLAPASSADASFARRYVTAIAFGPFAITTIVAALLGRLPVALWGYPLWSFAPLAVLMWAKPIDDQRRLRMFAAGALAVLLAMPAAYTVIELYEPFARDRPKATQFPGRQLAEIITREWRQATGSPLVYVGGGEFSANNVAVYSPDRPHVVVMGDPKLSPWVDVDDLRRRGLVLVWVGDNEARLRQWLDTFPNMQLRPPFVLQRQTSAQVRPVNIHYAIVPPRP